MNKTGQIFWLDEWKGKGKGGCYTRSNLNACIKSLNDKGAKIVGIKINLDGESNWTLETIIEEKK